MNNLYPPFQEKVWQLLADAKVNKLPEVGIFQGYRSWGEQDALYAQGRTKPGKIVTKAKGGQSWHNFGIAVDMVFKEKGQWSWSAGFPWYKIGALGKKLGLEWGGDWESFQDKPHFQWPTKLTLAQAREFYHKGGLEEVWKHL